MILLRYFSLFIFYLFFIIELNMNHVDFNQMKSHMHGWYSKYFRNQDCFDIIKVIFFLAVIPKGEGVGRGRGSGR